MKALKLRLALLPALSLLMGVMIAALITACAAAQPSQPPVSEQEAAAQPAADEAKVEEAPASEVQEETTNETETEAAVSESKTEQDPVVVILGADVDTLDPAHHAGAFIVIRDVFDTLLTKNEADELQPGVATEWSQVEDTVWEFKIREGLKAHNGEVIDANDVAYSLNRVLDPEVQAKGHFLWLAGNYRLKQAEAIDNQTVHLHTDGISGFPPDFLWTWPILPQEHYESTPLETLAREPVGSGPYKFIAAESQKGDHYTLEANEDYWAGAPEVKKVIFRIVPEVSTRIAEFNTGAADMLWLAPPPDLQDQIDSNMGRMVNVPSLTRVINGIVFYNNPAIESKALRQALNYGVDVQTIIDNLLAGRTKRSGSFVNPPNIAPTINPYPYDPEKARALLQEAGFEDSDGDGFVEGPDGNRLELTLQTPKGAWVKDFEVAQAIAADLQKIGVFVDVETMEFGSYIGMLADAKATGELWFQAAKGGYGCQADASDFSNHTQWQPGKWKNDEYDDTFLELTQTVDPDKRQELCYKLQEILYEEAPVIFLYNDVDPYAMSHRIEWTPYPNGRNNFSTLKWAK
ncbi:MAG: hypothetical protein KJ077_41755 [Anaerolineae bacterium]|nr:hypothetical protein [Anaerolineae bacterium]